MMSTMNGMDPALMQQQMRMMQNMSPADMQRMQQQMGSMDPTTLASQAEQAQKMMSAQQKYIVDVSETLNQCQLGSQYRKQLLRHQHSLILMSLCMVLKSQVCLLLQHCCYSRTANMCG